MCELTPNSLSRLIIWIFASESTTPRGVDDLYQANLFLRIDCFDAFLRDEQTTTVFLSFPDAFLL